VTVLILAVLEPFNVFPHLVLDGRLREPPCPFPRDLLQQAAGFCLFFLSMGSSFFVAYPSSPAGYKGYIEVIRVSIGYAFILPINNI
jgi:hypothetical protein